MIIEALIAVTFLAALITFILPDRYTSKAAFALSLAPVVGSPYMWQQYDASGNALLGGNIAFETDIAWLQLGQYDIHWMVGIDGINMPLIILTTVLTTLAIASVWAPISERQSQFFGLMLLMEANLLSVFTALDFFVRSIFWEAVLLPMYFLIGVWGGPRRKHTVIKFFVYTNIASLMMFIGSIPLVFSFGNSISSFHLPEIAQALQAGQLESFAGLSAGASASVAFVAMFFGFAVEAPVAPLHTRLSGAYIEAPTPVSVMLAEVLLKMSTYALLRFNFTMLPEMARAFALPIAPFAVASVVYGALLALAQQGLKRIVAYSSVSLMGYVILGPIAYTTYGVDGATFQMVAHGLISGLMFMAVGVIYNTIHTRMVSDVSGIANRMLVTAGVFVAGAFGYMGLPLMAGFAVEFFIFKGAFEPMVMEATPLFTGAVMFGIVIVAGYLLFAMQQTLFGPFRFDGDHDIIKAPFHDVVLLAVLLLLTIVFGVSPDIFFTMIQDAVNPTLELGGTFQMTPLQPAPQWFVMAPAIVLALTGLALLPIDTIDPDPVNNGLLASTATLGTLAVGGIAGQFLIDGTDMESTGGAISLYGGVFVVDGMSLFFTFTFTSVAAMVSITSCDYLADQQYQGEFYTLVLFAATGMTLMGMSNSLATVFVGLELVPLPSYALVAFLKKDRGSIEAGLKYFLIGALSSAVSAFGVSLVFTITGSLMLPEITATFAEGTELAGVLDLSVLMIAGGFVLKTVSVPFHFQAPEAYEGAPAPASAFLSLALKATGFAVAFRMFTVAFPLETATEIGSGSVGWSLLFTVLAVVTMTLGNFAAATQNNVKRMFAYSSIGHAGYALIGLAATATDGGAANGDVLGVSMAHLFVYGFMNTGAFLFIAMVEKQGLGRTSEDYNGIASKAPIAASAMTVFMFSFAGLPPFGGFFSKCALFESAIGSGFWWLVAVGAANSALSLFYYNRVMKAMQIEEPSKPLGIGSQPVGLYVAIVFTTVGTVLLLPGFQPVIKTAQTVAAALF